MLGLSGRARANTDGQTLHERRHAASNLAAVSTHGERFSDCPFSGTARHGGRTEGLGSAERACRDKGDGEG